MLSYVLFGFGIFGLLGVSVLWPFVALPAYRWSRRRLLHRRPADRRPELSRSQPLRIDLLVPVHDEAKRIGATLSSMAASVQYVRFKARLKTPLVINTCVGADSCTDESADIARRFTGVQVKEFVHNQSKWATLKTLCLHSDSDWLVLVDAGTLWPMNFLWQIVQTITTRHDVVALAPAYKPAKGGWIHRLLWRVEMSLKQMESWSGGPVSVHGATVCYKTSALKKALHNLGQWRWLNDDVAIPLILRSLNPEGVILYPLGMVEDVGIEPNQLDIRRRKRILVGNLQWVRALLPTCFRRNPVVGLLSLRRLFRIFWAYWFGLVALSAALADQRLVLPIVAIGGILLLVSSSIRQLAGAAWVSLLAPFRMAGAGPPQEAAWQ